MSWNYRIIHFTDDIRDYYGLHEVYYDERGKLCARSDSDFAYGETVEELIETLEMYLSDAKKFPVLEDTEFPKGNYDERMGTNSNSSS